MLRPPGKAPAALPRAGGRRLLARRTLLPTGRATRSRRRGSDAASGTDQNPKAAPKRREPTFDSPGWAGMKLVTSDRLWPLFVHVYSYASWKTTSGVGR